MDMPNKTNSSWPSFPIREYATFFATKGEIDFNGIRAKIQSQFEAYCSGVYLARPIAEIIETRKLDGCQEWGILWTNILREFGVASSYIQGVDLQWLDKQNREWQGDDWQGHVFIQTELRGETVTFCSTTARIVNRKENPEGQSIVDDRFVVLFEGRGPEEFKACDQGGINTFLRPLVAGWAEQRT
jgi:hypothetical protein